jgi:predicted GNAT family N-acyltransferase
VSLDYVNDLQDEDAFQLVAVSQHLGEFVAATRVLPPTTRPFDTERYVALSRVLDANRTPAEIGRLCLRHDWRRAQAPFVSAGLLALAVRLARKHDITDLILSALPNLVNFYRVGFFDVLDLTYDHPVWGTLRVMRLDLLALQDRLSGSEKPLARLLMDPNITSIMV